MTHELGIIYSQHQIILSSVCVLQRTLQLKNETTMKLIVITLSTIISRSSIFCHAFAPQYVEKARSPPSSTTLLKAETLEGWKIDGIVKPVNNFILVEKAKEQTESDGGILLSNSVSPLNG